MNAFSIFKLQEPKKLSNGDLVLWYNKTEEGTLSFVLPYNQLDYCNDTPEHPIVLYFFETSEGTKVERHVHVKEPIEESMNVNFVTILEYIKSHYMQVLSDLTEESAKAKANGHLH